VCKRHSTNEHDAFINYRVATEKDLSLKIFYALSLQKKTNGEALKVFLDRQCLPDGEDYEIQFVTAIKTSPVIILLISEAGISNIQNADQWQDNVLLEYELALAQYESENAVLLPLLVPTVRVIEGETFISKFKKFGTDQYPDAPHISPKSGKNIRATMKKLFGLQGIHVDVDNLEATLPLIEEQIKAMEKRKVEKSLNGPDGEVSLKIGGKPMNLYVHQKKFYISLIYPNFCIYKNPVRNAGNDLITIFSKIRFDPFTNLVKTNDFTFAASVGKIFNSNDPHQKYATCGGCEKDYCADGSARVDLRGTTFAVNDTFKHEGWRSAGTWRFSENNQVVELTGGGHCGGTSPAKASDKDAECWILQLKPL